MVNHELSTQNRITRYIAFLALATFCVLSCAGCGHVKSAKELYKIAKNKHGKCELVSKEESEEKTRIVLIDKKQGFQYEMVSRMDDINIDGSSFGSLPGMTDTFDMSLKSFVVGQCRGELDEICKKYDASHEDDSSILLLILRVPEGSSEANAAKLVEEVAVVMQEYNVDNRMDGFEINVTYDDKNNSHIGSVRLPDCTFRDREKEKEDFFTDIAKTYNSEAEFVRSDKRPFSDVGIDINRVSGSMDEDYPKVEKMSDPVTFYYFKAGDEEFYICNFIDCETSLYYTNYVRK